MLADLLDGKIAAVGVVEDYGVVLTPEGTAVDEVLAKERRAARRRAR